MSLICQLTSEDIKHHFIIHTATLLPTHHSDTSHTATLLVVRSFWSLSHTATLLVVRSFWSLSHTATLLVVRSFWSLSHTATLQIVHPFWSLSRQNGLPRKSIRKSVRGIVENTDIIIHTEPKYWVCSHVSCAFVRVSVSQHWNILYSHHHREPLQWMNRVPPLCVEESRGTTK